MCGNYQFCDLSAGWINIFMFLSDHKKDIIYQKITSLGLLKR